MGWIGRAGLAGSRFQMTFRILSLTSSRPIVICLQLFIAIKFFSLINYSQRQATVQPNILAHMASAPKLPFEEKL